MAARRRLDALATQLRHSLPLRELRWTMGKAAERAKKQRDEANARRRAGRR